MTRYILAFGMLGLASLAYLILATLVVRFDRTDELPSDGDTQDAIRERIKRERAGHTHFGSANK